MIDTANMGIMANLIQPTSSNISTQMISKKDSNSDSSLSSKEMGFSNDIFSSYDSDSSGLISQSELTTAIETAMSQFDGSMPSKEDFRSMLSSFGFESPSGSTNDTTTSSSSTSSSQSETISSILLEYDSSNLSQNDAKSIVSAFQEAGIEPSEELVSAMAEAGFDAKEVGTLAGVAGPQGGGGGGAPMASSDTSEVYDAMDTNEDGTISIAELQAAYSSSSSTSSTTSVSSNQQNALDNLSVLMDVLKSGNTSEDGTSSVDTKSFDGILKAINNQNNNSQINTYLQNTTSSSLFGYA
jgi:Ca2+-binding EF-hand superfamily protein